MRGDLGAAIGRLAPSFPAFEPGHVWLAGAGPGSLGCLTLEVIAALSQADAVVYDALVDPAALRERLLGPEFEVGAFKGQKLTIRDWDQQLRQPILLASDNLVVSVSPQDGFLHQFSPLDTLGTDRPETACSFN